MNSIYHQLTQYETLKFQPPKYSQSCRNLISFIRANYVLEEKSLPELNRRLSPVSLESIDEERKLKRRKAPRIMFDTNAC